MNAPRSRVPRRLLSGASIFALLLVLRPINAGAVSLTPLKLGLSRISSGLASPVAIASPNDASGRIFVVEQAGRIRVRLASGSLPSYLDIRSKVLSGGERGMLGLAFHPSFSSNGYFFASYTNSGGALVVARFKAAPSANSAPASSEIDFLTVEHPNYGNHNGGSLAFGPDGFLYIGTGDGGSANDPGNNAHDTTRMLGKIHRIDVNRACGGLHYCIPGSNPFASSSTARKEIWLYGLRNPWRFSFDRSNGSLWIADVGQGNIEEIDHLGAGVGGKNLGWDCWEGTSRVDNSGYCTPFSSTVGPVTQYNHASGDCAVIGGYAYRGARYDTSMGGVYLYGDYCTGKIRGLAGGSTRLLYTHSGHLTSFGEDRFGELYVVDSEGSLYHVTASGGPKPPPPVKISSPSTPAKATPTPLSIVSPSPSASPPASEQPSSRRGSYAWLIPIGLAAAAVAIRVALIVRARRRRR